MSSPSQQVPTQVPPVSIGTDASAQQQRTTTGSATTVINNTYVNADIHADPAAQHEDTSLFPNAQRVHIPPGLDLLGRERVKEGETIPSHRFVTGITIAKDGSVIEKIEPYPANRAVRQLLGLTGEQQPYQSQRIDVPTSMTSTTAERFRQFATKYRQFVQLVHADGHTEDQVQTIAAEIRSVWTQFPRSHQQHILQVLDPPTAHRTVPQSPVYSTDALARARSQRQTRLCRRMRKTMDAHNAREKEQQEANAAMKAQLAEYKKLVHDYESQQRRSQRRHVHFNDDNDDNDDDDDDDDDDDEDEIIDDDLEDDMCGMSMPDSKKRRLNNDKDKAADQQQPIGRDTSYLEEISALLNMVGLPNMPNQGLESDRTGIIPTPIPPDAQAGLKFKPKPTHNSNLSPEQLLQLQQLLDLARGDPPPPTPTSTTKSKIVGSLLSATKPASNQFSQRM